MNRASPLFIGIDGGGTRSVGIAVDRDGVVQATARAGSLNFFGSGLPVARRSLKSLVAALLGQPGGVRSFERATIGCAALFTDATLKEKRLLCQGILPLARTRVVSDSQTAYFGATQGAPGVVIIAGTGSIVLARNERGHFLSAGGWGHLLGDEGSAWWIAAESIKAAIAAGEGRGPKTALSTAVPRWFGVARLSDLVPKVYRSDFGKDQFAALAGDLAEKLAARDAVFRSICRRAGRELAVQTLAAARRSGVKARPLPVFLLGSVLTENAAVRNRLVRALRVAMAVRLATARLTPTSGAAAMAMVDAGIKLTPAIVANLAKPSRQT